MLQFNTMTVSNPAQFDRGRCSVTFLTGFSRCWRPQPVGLKLSQGQLQIVGEVRLLTATMEIATRFTNSLAWVVPRAWLRTCGPGSNRSPIPRNCCTLDLGFANAFIDAGQTP